MQIFLPSESDTNVEQILQGREVLGRWRDDAAKQIALHLLVPAEETEQIMDQLEGHFSEASAFHVVLFPVEAVLPRGALKDLENNEGPGLRAVNKEGERISREELYTEVSESLGLSYVFAAMCMLSAVVAAVGLMRDDVAVIIGAMVIAPLLGPNVAMSLATTLGDTRLLWNALVTNLAGIAVAFGVSVGVGIILTVDSSVPAIAARTKVGLADIVLALAAGSAGTFAYTRGLAGPVIGVMVAVALVPPLVVFGMLLGAGQVSLALGALLLTVANVIGINLAGTATFLAQGVRPRNWWEAERAKTATRTAICTWLVLLAALMTILWATR